MQWASDNDSERKHTIIEFTSAVRKGVSKLARCVTLLPSSRKWRACFCDRCTTSETVGFQLEFSSSLSHFSWWSFAHQFSGLFLTEQDIFIDAIFSDYPLQAHVDFQCGAQLRHIPETKGKPAIWIGAIPVAMGTTGRSCPRPRRWQDRRTQPNRFRCGHVWSSHPSTFRCWGHFFIKLCGRYGKLGMRGHFDPILTNNRNHTRIMIRTVGQINTSEWRGSTDSWKFAIYANAQRLKMLSNIHDIVDAVQFLGMRTKSHTSMQCTYSTHPIRPLWVPAQAREHFVWPCSYARAWEHTHPPTHIVIIDVYTFPPKKYF